MRRFFATCLVAALVSMLHAARGWAQATAPSVALDMSALDESQYRDLNALELEKYTIVRLVQDGFAVVSPSAQPEVLMTYSIERDRVVIEARTKGGVLHRDVVLTGARRVSEIHLEVAQKTVALARSAHRPAPKAHETPLAPAATEPAEPIVPARVVADVQARPPEGGSIAQRKQPQTPGSTTQIALETSAGLDALWRDGGVDPLVRIGLGLGIGRVLVASVQGGLSPSSGTAMSVLEWQLQAGLGVLLWARGRIVVEAEALLGLLWHHFDLDDPAALDSTGGRLEWLASTPVSITYHPRPALGVGLRLAAGLSESTRRHVENGHITWERGAFRVESGVTLSWTW